jgi:hypothetical protein
MPAARQTVYSEVNVYHLNSRDRKSTLDRLEEAQKSYIHPLTPNNPSQIDSEDDQIPSQIDLEHDQYLPGNFYALVNLLALSYNIQLSMKLYLINYMKNCL